MRASEVEESLVIGVPTGEQWGSYWGRTSTERYNAVFESVSVSFLGLFASYFLSFVVGSPLATLSGGVAFFWSLLGPELRAYRRNRELRGGRDLVDPPNYDGDERDDDDEDFWDDDDDDPDSRGLYGALYLGSVDTVRVVEDAYSPDDETYPLSDFYDYDAEEDDRDPSNFPWRLRLGVRDRDGRALQVHARLSEEYLDLERGMPVATVLLSTRHDFTELAAVADFFVPDADCWVGDYPYLDRVNFRRRLSSSRRTRRLLERERGGASSSS